MKTLILFFGLRLILSLQAVAQTPMDAAMAAHGSRMEALNTQRDLDRLKLKQTYKGALEGLLTQARSGGNLELFVATEAEIQRIDPGVQVPDPFSLFPELARLQGILAQQLQKLDIEHAGRVLQSYRLADEALDALQKQLVRDGNIEDAKAVDAHRKAMMADELFVWAASQSKLEVLPVSAGGQRRPATAQQVQAYFKGRVTHFNPVNLEVELTYDFSRPDQVVDFKWIRGERFTIEEGVLKVSVPPGSDWWNHLKMMGPSLWIPFLEAGPVSLGVDLVAFGGNEPYHLAVGFSDLDKKTIGMGPLSTTKTLAVEGWTPALAEFRDRTSMLPVEKGVRVTALLRGAEIQFTAARERRTATLNVATAKELRYPGLYPKAWGAAGANASYDNLVVKGTLNLEWLAERTP
jgi:hypothetical protein